MANGLDGARPGRRRRLGAVRGTHHAKRVRRGASAVAVVAVFTVATLGATAGIAAATGLTYGTVDSASHFAECNLNLWNATSSAFSSEASLESSYAYAHGASAYTHFHVQNYSLRCNSAFPDSVYSGGSTNSWSLSMFFGGTHGLNQGNTFESATDVYGKCAGGAAGLTCNSNGSFLSEQTTASPGAAGTGVLDNRAIGCLDASFFSSSDFTGLSSGQQQEDTVFRCDSAHLACWVTSSGDGYTLPHHSTPDPYWATDDGCGITVHTATTGTADQPGFGWGSQSIALPPPPAPMVTCGVTVNTSTGVAAFSGSVTAAAGTTEETISEGWVFGDLSSEVGSTPNVNHPYTAAAEPSGGFVAVYTAVGLGDGVTYSATTTLATCTKTVSLVSGSGTGGGTSPDTSTGGSAPPTDCGWTDLACMVEKAVAWLVVPHTGSTSAWATFVSDLKTKIPFTYVVSAATFVYEVGGAFYGTGDTAPSCYSVRFDSGHTSCASAGSSGVVADMRFILALVFTAGFILATVAEARVVVRSH
jgi:hypothetical protein